MAFGTADNDRDLTGREAEGGIELTPGEIDTLIWCIENNTIFALPSGKLKNYPPEVDQETIKTLWDIFCFSDECQAQLRIAWWARLSEVSRENMLYQEVLNWPEMHLENGPRTEYVWGSVHNFLQPFIKEILDDKRVRDRIVSKVRAAVAPEIIRQRFGRVRDDLRALVGEATGDKDLMTALRLLLTNIGIQLDTGPTAESSANTSPGPVEPDETAGE